MANNKVKNIAPENLPAPWRAPRHTAADFDYTHRTARIAAMLGHVDNALQLHNDKFLGAEGYQGTHQGHPETLAQVEQLLAQVCCALGYGTEQDERNWGI